MAISIDHNKAEKVLLAAFRARCLKNDSISVKIKSIINGHHKTYRYILVNGLLAKATHEAANPLALQAGSKLYGSFDARSLCHKVLVPFERDFLHKALGGSNEPFLNKPARNTELSETNPVRKGKDTETLLSLIEIFNAIESSNEAMSYLSCSLEYLNEKIAKLQALNNSEIKYEPTLVEIYEFIIRFCEKSFEGETSVIVIAALEKLYYSQLKEEYRIVAHKVNQSGASSKEIGDIDIYKDNQFLYAIEVKDKGFTTYDVSHAFDKMIKNLGTKGQFIYGPNSSHSWSRIRATLKSYKKRGFFTYFEGLHKYSRVTLFKFANIEKGIFIKTLIETADEINAKQATREWIQELLIKLSWK